MSEDLSNKTVLIYDQGQFVDLALRLSRDFGRVQYFKPWKKSAPVSCSLMVGDGHPEFERVRDFFDAVPESDLIVFPDCYDGDLQVYLESQGKRVWGSRKAERYEFMRQLFKKTLGEVDLPVSPYKIVVGITALREHLLEHDNQIVKLSICRGDSETFDCPNYLLRKSKIDALEFAYGPAAESISFMVEDIIETEIEVGYDGICIDGQFTDAFVDYEVKNQACLIACRKYEDMAESVRLVNDKFAPVLRRERYRSAWGTEIRVDKEGTPFFIDATCRNPSPPGEAMWELFKNLSEIMWHGSNGDFVQAEFEAKFGCEIMLYMDWEDRAWQEIEIPAEYRRWVKLATSCKVNGLYYPIANEGYEPLPWGTEEIGAAIGVGDTIEEAIDAAKEHASAVAGFKISYDLSSIVEGIESIKSGEKEGVEFGSTPLPEPAQVLNQ